MEQGYARSIGADRSCQGVNRDGRAGRSGADRIHEKVCAQGKIAYVRQHDLSGSTFHGAWHAQAGNILPLSQSGCVDIERSEEHTSELQSLMRISYAVFCLKKKKNTNNTTKLNATKPIMT